MKAQVLAPPSDFKLVNAAALSALGANSVTFDAGRIRQSGSHATARVRERFALALGR